jgi:hypothetical protein
MSLEIVFKAGASFQATALPESRVIRRDFSATTAPPPTLSTIFDNFEFVDGMTRFEPMTLPLELSTLSMSSKHFSQMLKSQRKQQNRLVPVFSTSMGSV